MSPSVDFKSTLLENHKISFGNDNFEGWTIFTRMRKIFNTCDMPIELRLVIITWSRSHHLNLCVVSFYPFCVPLQGAGAAAVEEGLHWATRSLPGREPTLQKKDIRN